ncbi:MAG: DUF1269 domain-containing protein [Coleofasciculus sp. Co-bin14]|nr:DUF1269 domain-containing protein [Coleofasciculus sp. Co-bin14]
MVLEQGKLAVGLFSSCQDTESALNDLKDSGFSIKKIGVLTKDLGCEAQGSYAERTAQVVARPQDGAGASRVTSAAKVGLGSLLVGLGTLAIAGVGTVVETETGKTALADIFPGNGIGAFADTWMGALTGRGIPGAQASIYSDRVSHNDYLILIESTHQEMATAERILSKWGIQEWCIYDAPKAEAVNS